MDKLTDSPHPVPQLKVRLQAPGATGSLRWHAAQIVRQHGFQGLYKAVWPTTVRAGILTSSQLGVYDHAKHTCVRPPGGGGLTDPTCEQRPDAFAHGRARRAPRQVDERLSGHVPGRLADSSRCERLCGLLLLGDE